MRFLVGAVWTTWLGCHPPSGTGDSAPITSTGTPPTDEGVEVEVRASSPVACDEPGRRDLARFDELASRAEADKKIWFFGAGTVVADVDGDGRLDALLPGFWETMLYLGTVDGWVDASDRLAGLPLALSSGGSAADYDGDGDLDLLVTRFLAPDVLLRNDGGTFVDVSTEAGLSTDARRSMTSSWGDFDHDGDLDLFVGCYGYIDESGSDPDHATFDPAEPSWLYVNDGDGTFTDRSDLLPPEVHVGYTLAGGWFDLDQDGWLDLYVVNDFGSSYPNRLLWNRQGTLELDGNRVGLDVSVTGMGVGVGDLDDDGVEDLLMGTWNGNKLMMSGAGGAWFDYTQAKGVANDLERQQKIAWGTEFVDMDDDGDLDALMAYGFLASRYPASRLQPDALYLQGEDGTFEDVGADWGLNQPFAGRGFAAVDWNDDGYVDVVKRALDGPSTLHLSRCGNAAWLRVRLHAPAPNTFAVGARITVHHGGRSWSRTVRAGGTNHASGGPPEVHFGLGELTRVDWMQVDWPDGEVSRLFDVDTRRILDLTRTE